MKDLKVKNLHPVLQNVARRAVCTKMIVKDDDYAENLLAHVDWSKCTDEERLKYAELMYYEGVSARCLISKASGIVTGKHRISVGNILCDAVNIKSGYLFLYTVGNWAEIISGPDEKEETKEPEFQPGEISVLADDSNWDDAHWNYLGVKDKRGWFVCQTRVTNEIRAFQYIRKIQPDPEKEIAKQAVSYIDTMCEFYKGIDRDIQIAVTAIRKYKALKTEIK